MPRSGLKTWELTDSFITLSSEVVSSVEGSCETADGDASVSKDFNEGSIDWFDDSRFNDFPSFFARFR